MSQTPPFRVRPNLRLTFTPEASPSGSRYGSPLVTPRGTATYSPFRSASLRAPTPHDSPVQFTPRSSSFAYGSYGWSRFRRVAMSRVLWFATIFIALLWWWSNGGRQELDTAREKSSMLSQDIFGTDMTSGLSFFPASNPKIHYVGRWTATPNHLRQDGTFAGTYFDVTVNSTSTVLLSLYNAAPPSVVMSADPSSLPTSVLRAVPDLVHLSFRPSTILEKAPPPIHLLARINQEEYVLLPNASSLVTVRFKDLDSHALHDIRIIAPMVESSGSGILALEGIWLDKGGKLLRVEGSQLAYEVEEEDAFEAENENIGEKHRIGLSRLHRHGFLHDTSRDTGELSSAGEDEDEDADRISGERRKVLEIITDSPGALQHAKDGTRVGGGAGILGGVMGWEYLLGEMFSVDHVSIGVDGMCLTQDCIGGAGEPAGMGDVFFRSGPAESPYFSHPWMFNPYIPDVLVLNLGRSDFESFERYSSEYNKTSWELFERFEDTYVAFVKAIRQLAYPKHPSVAAAESGLYSLDSNTAPSSIPIFIMRPLRGEFEHATQGAVNRLRADGDKSVFWLDTSGWLDLDDANNDAPDFYREETANTSHWRLTERGNQRVAIFLHLHVCQYLAEDVNKCAFLPPEVYQGRVYNPEEANLDRHLESEKERKLKDFFWGSEQPAGEVLLNAPSTNADEPAEKVDSADAPSAGDLSF